MCGRLSFYLNDRKTSCRIHANFWFGFLCAVYDDSNVDWRWEGNLRCSVICGKLGRNVYVYVSVPKFPVNACFPVIWSKVFRQLRIKTASICEGAFVWSTLHRSKCVIRICQYNSIRPQFFTSSGGLYRYAPCNVQANGECYQKQQSRQQLNQTLDVRIKYTFRERFIYSPRPQFAIIQHSPLKVFQGYLRKYAVLCPQFSTSSSAFSMPAYLMRCIINKLPAASCAWDLKFLFY